MRSHLVIHGGSHGAMMGRMLAEIEQALLEHKPDRVLVYGDTNSTQAGALDVAKLHIPVAHFEAGCAVTICKDRNRSTAF